MFCVVATYKSFENYPSCVIFHQIYYNPEDVNPLKNAETCVNWWRRPSILKKLIVKNIATYIYVTIHYTSRGWLGRSSWDNELTNPVESIDRQSIYPTNTKLVSLKPLIEHFYLEDKKIGTFGNGYTDANITISQATKRKQKDVITLLINPPEKQSSLLSVATGKWASIQYIHFILIITC